MSALTDHGRTLATIAFAVLLVSSTMLGAVPASVVASASVSPSSSPAGMTALPESNIRANFGNQSSVNATAADFEGSTMSSAHPESLTLTVTSGNRVLGPDGEPMGDADELILQFSDDTNHEGRDVAVPMKVIRKNNGGTIPSVAWGYHESGETWSSKVRREGSLLVFNVPKFSTQTVSFSGKVSVQGSPAMHGATYSYEVADLDAVENYQINVTGRNATQRDSESGIYTSGDSMPVTISGTDQPRNPDLVLTGVETTSAWNASGTDATNGATASVNVDGNQPPENATITFVGNRSTSAGSGSGTGSTNTSTTSVSVGGNLAPENVTATFTGNNTLKSASASGSNVGNGGNASVSVAGDGDPQNVAITFNGDTVKSSTTSSGSAAAGGSSSISLAGNLEPTGPASGEPKLTVTAYREKKSIGTDKTFSTAGCADSKGVWHNFTSPVSQLEKAKYTIYFQTAYDVNMEMYVDGTNVETWNHAPSSSGTYTYTNTSISYSPTNSVKYHVCEPTSGSWHDSDSHTLKSSHIMRAPPQGVGVSTASTSVSFGNYAAGGNSKSKAINLSLSDSSLSFSSNNGGTFDWTLDYTARTATEDPAVDVDGDGINDASYAGLLKSGQTATKSISTGKLTAGSNTLSFALTAGQTDWTLDYDENHWTTDPAVDVDGDGTLDASYSGILSPGSSQTVSVDAGDLATGSNSVNFTVAGPAPTDWTLDWTAVTAVKDPGVDVDGDGLDDAVYTGTLDSGQSATKSVSGLSAGSNSLTFSEATGGTTPFDWTVEATAVTHTEDPAVDIDGDGINDVSYSGILSPGTSVSDTAPELSLSTSSLAISSQNSSDVDVELNYTEVTASKNPEVEVNGHITDYLGTLNDGETVSLTTNTSWVGNGTNRVNVSVSPNVAADAPNGRIGLDYSHDAVDKQTVDTVSETWTTRYNVSKTYAGERQNATLSASLPSNVVEIRDFQKRINGSTWSSVSSSEYNLSGTTLTYDMGHVDPDTKVELKVNASKVQVGNGQIDVLKPTTPGNTLATKFEVVERHPGFYIGVSGSDPGNFLHYLANESWTSPDPYSEHQADGDQFVYTPNAGNGSTAYIHTLPVEIEPKTGDVNIRVANASSTKPKLSVTPGSSLGEDVVYRFHNTESGKTYELYSVSAEVVRDSAEAQSPVDLLDDDSEETLLIRLQTDSSTSGTGGDGPISFSGGGPVGEGAGPLNSVPVVLGTVLLGMAGVFLLLRRRLESRIYVLGGTAATATVAIVAVGEYLRPGIILGPVGRNLGRVTPVLAMIAAILGGYYFYVRFIRGYGPGYRPGGRR